jgi:hypothetical protein
MNKKLNSLEKEIYPVGILYTVHIYASWCQGSEEIAICEILAKM